MTTRASAEPTHSATSKAIDMRVAIGASSLGQVLVAESDAGIGSVLIGDDSDVLRHDLEERFPLATLSDGNALTENLGRRIIEYIEAPGEGLDIPLDIRGTEFQRTVWQALGEIPAGSTASYTEVAKRIGKPGSVRAVAHACAANPLAVLIPCHRVVGSDGSLTGYRWGIDRKRALLEREARLDERGMHEQF